jgi:hypothetical protein
LSIILIAHLRGGSSRVAEDSSASSSEDSSASSS